MHKHLTRLACSLALGLTMPCVAMAQSVAPDAAAGASLTSLLDARIAVTWKGDVDGLAKLLALRLDVPYESIGSAVAQQIALEQPASLTVADALANVNGQLQQRAQLNLVQVNHEVRLEYQELATHSALPVQTFAVSGQPAAMEPAKPVAPVAAQAPQAPQETEVPQSWQVGPEDVTLFDALTRWSKQADWQVVWETTDDLLIPAKATYHGTYRQAVRALFLSFATSLVPTFYMDNNVVRVTDVGSRTSTGAQQQ